MKASFNGDGTAVTSDGAFINVLMHVSGRPLEIECRPYEGTPTSPEPYISTLLSIGKLDFEYTEEEKKPHTYVGPATDARIYFDLDQARELRDALTKALGE